MRRKRSLLILCITILTVSALVFKASSKQPQEAAANTPHASPLPEHVAYWFLFHHSAALKRKADEVEKKGKSSSLRALIKRDADLNDGQAATLETISLECEREVAEKDAQAKVVIAAVRARYPDGKIPRGESLPPVPPALEALQQERDAIILRARDRLHEAFGDQDFQRFDSFVKKDAGAHTQIKSPDHQ